MTVATKLPSRVEVRTRPPRCLLVVREPDPADIDSEVDWSPWYLTDEEDMGEGFEQGEINRMFMYCLQELVRELSREAKTEKS